ncbi:MAG: hypothetical protein GXY77_02215 [Fibrobacter sp.]|nr:hypothetical protein [Fibrobacter sp.]
MRYFKFILTIILINFFNIFSQKLPDFTVHKNSQNPGDYFSDVLFYENSSQKVGDDYLFESIIYPDNNTLVTDSIFFGFNKPIYSIRIKKISFSRNGSEYFIVDSFPVRDTLKWVFVEHYDYNQGDSIIFLDSMLKIKFSSFGKTSIKILKLKMDEEISINKDDTFKLLLDTIPSYGPTGTVPFLDNTGKLMSSNKNIKAISLINDSRRFSFGGQTPNRLFNLAGKKQCFKKASNIYIIKFKPDAVQK